MNGLSPPSNSGSQLSGKRRNKNDFRLVDLSKAFRLLASLWFRLVRASNDINPNMLAIINSMQMLAAASWLIQSLRIVAWLIPDLISLLARFVLVLRIKIMFPALRQVSAMMRPLMILLRLCLIPEILRIDLWNIQSS